ncbi:MAG TPA: hypothetical protein VGA53_04605 [Candidatus Paceibacterota bacterium]
MNPPHDFKSEIKLFLIVAVVSVFIAVAGILLLQSMRPAPSPQAQTEDLDISDWKTYRNDDLGIEFKYPINFVPSSEGFALENQNSDAESALITVASFASRRSFDDELASFSHLSTVSRSLEEVNQQILDVSLRNLTYGRAMIIEGVGYYRNRPFVPYIRTIIKPLSGTGEWEGVVEIDIRGKGNVQNYDVQKKSYTELEGLRKLNNSILSTFRFVE